MPFRYSAHQLLLTTSVVLLNPILLIRLAQCSVAKILTYWRFSNYLVLSILLEARNVAGENIRPVAKMSEYPLSKTYLHSRLDTRSYCCGIMSPIKMCCDNSLALSRAIHLQSVIHVFFIFMFAPNIPLRFDAWIKCIVCTSMDYIRTAVKSKPLPLLHIAHPSDLRALPFAKDFPDMDQLPYLISSGSFTVAV